MDELQLEQVLVQVLVLQQDLQIQHLLQFQQVDVRVYLVIIQVLVPQMLLHLPEVVVHLVLIIIQELLREVVPLIRHLEVVVEVQ